jgi:hypothetical protein
VRRETKINLGEVEVIRVIGGKQKVVHRKREGNRTYGTDGTKRTFIAGSVLYVAWIL